jgi:putative oxygen-independent coproporphyrinogen III oxidase
MAGLYIHIPFCKQKCHYCNFYSLATKKHRNELPEAMKQEIELKSDFFDGKPLQTIYFGGGTPSLIPADEIKLIISKADAVFGIAPNAEITLEANPDDVNTDWLEALRDSQVNRLSIGIQSFDDNDLKYLNRIHTSKQAEASIQKALKAGFSNLSIDLIYGIPTLSEDVWKANIDKTLSFAVPHISAYALTVEPGTALDLLIKKGKYTPVDDEKAVTHFDLLMGEMERAGYDHYEISNFSLPGRHSKHNTAYWNGTKYLGIGPSAHSFDGKKRCWNVAHIKKYIEGIAGNKRNYDCEELTESQHFNEYMMTALRTIWGIDLLKVNQRFGDAFSTHLMKQLQHPEKQGLVKIRDNKVVLTHKGKFFADGVAGGLFV